MLDPFNYGSVFDFWIHQILKYKKRPFVRKKDVSFYDKPICKRKSVKIRLIAVVLNGSFFTAPCEWVIIRNFTVAYAHTHCAAPKNKSVAQATCRLAKLYFILLWLSTVCEILWVLCRNVF